MVRCGGTARPAGLRFASGFRPGRSTLPSWSKGSSSTSLPPVTGISSRPETGVRKSGKRSSGVSGTGCRRTPTNAKNGFRLPRIGRTGTAASTRFWERIKTRSVSFGTTASWANVQGPTFRSSSGLSSVRRAHREGPFVASLSRSDEIGMRAHQCCAFGPLSGP